MPDGGELVNSPTRFQNQIKFSGVITIFVLPRFISYLRFHSPNLFEDQLDSIVEISGDVVCVFYCGFGNLFVRYISQLCCKCGLNYGSSVCQGEAIFTLFLYDFSNVFLFGVDWCPAVFNCLTLENCWAVWVSDCSLYDIPYSDTMTTVYRVYDATFSFNLIIFLGIDQTVVQVYFL